MPQKPRSRDTDLTAQLKSMLARVDELERLVQTRLGSAPANITAAQASITSLNSSVATINATLSALGSVQTWTATWIQNVTPAQTLDWANYVQIAKLVIAWWHVTSNGSGTSGQTQVISHGGTLPTFAQTGGGGTGNCWWIRQGVAFHHVHARTRSDNGWDFLIEGAGAAVTTQFLSTDIHSGFVVYQSA